MREQLDLKLDLYKDVDDIKYHFKYPTAGQFYDTRFKFQEGQLAIMKPLSKAYFEHVYGLKTDQFETFAEERKQAQRSKQQFGEEEKAQVRRDLGAM